MTFPQRFPSHGVESAMKQIRLTGLISHDAIETLRSFFILWAILLGTVLFIGCATTRNEQADANTIIRQPEKGYEVHGEIGAMYGNSLSRH